jgi:hypothetical protein
MAARQRHFHDIHGVADTLGTAIERAAADRRSAIGDTEVLVERLTASFPGRHRFKSGRPLCRLLRHMRIERPPRSRAEAV